MDSNSKKDLLKELEYYTDLLKKHEAAKKENQLSTFAPQFSKYSSWKQPSFSSYKMIKTPVQHFSSKTNYKFNKFQKSESAYPKIRTEFNAQTNHFKANYKLTSNKIGKNFPSNKFTFQKTASSGPLDASTKPVFHSVNISSKVPCRTSDSSVKVVPNSLALIKEIESVTQLLKKTSEDKIKTKTLTEKDESTLQNKLFTSENISNLQTKPSACSINSTDSFDKKLSESAHNAFFCKDKSKQIFNLKHSNSETLAKNSYRKVCSQNIVNSKVQITPLKSVGNENSKSNLPKVSVELNVPKACQDFKVIKKLSSNVADLKAKALNQNKLGLKLDTPQLIDPKAILDVKCQNSFPKFNKVLTCLPNRNSPYNRYKRINGSYSFSNKNSLNKNLLSKNTFKATLTNKKIKKKINTKFKVINKTMTPKMYRKKRIVLSNSVCKETSPLPIDESDPLFKFLNDSTIDKIEKDLLALSTTMTVTPTSIDGVSQTLSFKVNSKGSSKKMPFRKSKIRMSKYKVVNSNFPNPIIRSRQSLMNLKRSKKINTKYSLVNQQVQSTLITPVRQGKSVLVKRLFKSKNAIINKNTSPTNQSAKMIKSKYFALYKRKLPYEKPAIYSKVPLYHPRLKGCSSSKLYHRKQYHKTIFAHRQRVMRRSLHDGYHSISTRYKKHVARNKSKKMHNGCVRSPVVFIQGVKYSRNSNGKALRKFPLQDLRKIHRKVSINAKGFGKTPDNRMKFISPISTNLASRVLHRSITRVLSATSKKSLSKVNSYCMFYNRFGRCNRGIKCTYIHDPSKIAVCTRFLRGTCKTDGCPFSHEIAPGKMAICSFFLVGACDKNNCPYRHEKLSPNAQLCKAFVQGYCPNGKECKNAHILICPEYIQGNCEKGTSCAFPHPPQKLKKNLPKEIDQVKKSDDTLMEKVARYFEQYKDSSLCEKNSNETVAEVYVPRQRKLEEQPAYIPL